jgi:hypothetical protein
LNPHSLAACGFQARFLGFEHGPAPRQTSAHNTLIYDHLRRECSPSNIAPECTRSQYKTGTRFALKMPTLAFVVTHGSFSRLAVQAIRGGAGIWTSTCRYSVFRSLIWKSQCGDLKISVRGSCSASVTTMKSFWERNLMRNASMAGLEIGMTDRAEISWRSLIAVPVFHSGVDEGTWR